MDIFQRLAQLKSYRRTLIDNLNNEQSVEHGGVHYKEQKADALFIEERGKLKHSRYQNKTLNYYQWQLTLQQQLTLRHFRQQREGVLLASFDLACDATTFSTPPFHCGQDCYQAQLSVDAQKIVLLWDIKGPKKDCLIESHYSHF
jgi:hypothetical protein